MGNIVCNYAIEFANQPKQQPTNQSAIIKPVVA